MRTLTTLAATALIAFGFTDTASAYSFSPKSKTFTGTGTTKLVKGLLSIACTAHFAGKTDSLGRGFIWRRLQQHLLRRHPAGGPAWKALAVSATSATVYNAEVTASIFGTCGPSNVKVTVSSTGIIKFANQTLKPNCVVNGSVATTPHVTIVNP